MNRPINVLSLFDGMGSVLVSLFGIERKGV